MKKGKAQERSAPVREKDLGWIQGETRGPSSGSGAIHPRPRIQPAEPSQVSSRRATLGAPASLPA